MISQQQHETNRKLKIEEMFKKIQNTIMQFIQYLNKVYQQYNVSYFADQYFPTLIRLFSPFQLLSTHTIDQNTLYSTNKKQDNNSFNSKLQKNASQHLSIDQESLSVFDKINMNMNFQQGNQQIFSFNQYQEQQFNQDQNKNKSLIKNNMRKGRPRILLQDMQLQLCEWVKEEAAKGKSITRFKIANKAKQLVNSQDFQASQGWLDRFLKRYPEIKSLIGMKKIDPNKNHKKIDISNLNSIKKPKVKQYPKQKLKQRKQKQINEWHKKQQKYYDDQEKDSIYPFQNVEQYQKSIIFQQVVSGNDNLQKQKKQQISQMQDQSEISSSPKKQLQKKINIENIKIQNQQGIDKNKKIIQCIKKKRNQQRF